MKSCIQFSILLLLLISVLRGVGLAEEADISLMQPIWVDATGTAHGNRNDPPCEVMEQAQRDAERKAVELAVGTFVKADTLVINSVLDHKSIIAKVRGRLEKVEVLEEVRDKMDPDVFRVKIRALVRPEPLKEEDGIQVQLALSRKTFDNGDPLLIHYQTNVPAYVYIYSVAADNAVTMLFPNTLYQDNFVSAGKEQQFPPKGSSVPCRVFTLPNLKEKESTEKIVVIATRRREALLQGFQEANQVHTSKTTGTFGELYRKLSRLDPADYGEAVESYSIRRRMTVR